MLYIAHVAGVTQLRDVVYVVCHQSSAIRRRYSATTHRRLADIVVKGLRDPCDIAACELTSQLYVVDSTECVWRVSSDGAVVQRWLTYLSGTFKPLALSVTSSRLLVTSCSGRQLRQFDAAGGGKPRRVRLPDYMYPSHAVESPTATFIVSHYNPQLYQDQVSEVSTEGQVLRQFSGSLCCPKHIAVDRQGNIFVAVSANRRILLLNAQLALRRVIIDEHQLSYRRSERLCYTEDRQPVRLCYVVQSGQLLVGCNDGSVACFMCFGDIHTV